MFYFEGFISKIFTKPIQFNSLVNLIYWWRTIFWVWSVCWVDSWSSPWKHLGKYHW